jgi:hypothetical protein
MPKLYKKADHSQRPRTAGDDLPSKSQRPHRAMRSATIRPRNLSKKELAKEFRHEAYLRAKEYRRTDPRQIAMKEKIKERRREANQKAKELDKANRDEIKKASKDKSARKRIVKQDKLLKNVLVPASTIKGQETRITRQHAELVKAKKATVADIARLTGVSKQAVSQMLKKYAEEKKTK